jgi:hypothetical protein
MFYAIEIGLFGVDRALPEFLLGVKSGGKQKAAK